MSGHTTAPWSINDWPQSNSDIVIGAEGTPRIAAVLLRHVSFNEQKANANLITAAPELLTALEACVSCLTPGRDNAERRLARKAIAKATGQEVRP